MKKRTEKYEYVTLNPGQQLYNEYNLFEVDLVEAQYIKSSVPAYRGNPFIEALPLPRTLEECSIYYDIPIIGYNYGSQSKADCLTRIQLVSQLKKLRFPLPFHCTLEQEMYRALTESYSSRYQFFDQDVPLEIHVGKDVENTYGLLVGDESSASVSGFALLGHSGCGKSSALNILVSHYPQIISHPYSSGKMIQIVYLIVNCSPNSNFNALYESIGIAIDRALGISKGFYAIEVQKKRSLSQKAELIRKFVEMFAIGIIIFDEIQLVNFSGTQENTYDSLLSLSNKTKVAIAAVGTEDAYKKMFPNLRTARRIGSIIKASTYCENKQYFSVIVERLFKYQWFDTPIDITPEIITTLYENTKGIIDQLISIYRYMNIDYLLSKKRPQIDSKFIEHIVKKHYSGLKDLLDVIDIQSDDKKRTKIIETANLRMDEISTQHLQKAYEDIINKPSFTEKMETSTDMLNAIISNICVCFDIYDSEQISNAYRKVICIKSNGNKTEKELTQLVLRQLQSKKSNTRNNSKDKISLDTMKFDLLNS